MDNPPRFVGYVLIAFVFWITVSILLSGCASTDLNNLQTIKSNVDSRITYKNYFSKNYRYVSKDKKGEGNCAVFAQTYNVDAAIARIPGRVHIVDAGGIPHAVFVTDTGDVLDNRRSFVARIEEYQQWKE